ncbi:MAG: M23 family metallopeptidase [Cellvibrionaceae bacterium]|nr:M23 family metallopeptidase [Cellvibrionaceae bacterium]
MLLVQKYRHYSKNYIVYPFIIILKALRGVLVVVFCLFVLGFLIPEPRGIPVQGASSADWNPKSFWFEPWGSSGVHKGLDIFAKKGTRVLAPTSLLIIYRRVLTKGGNVALGLGPKWRLHYFAHMDRVFVAGGVFVGRGDELGTVGNSGNARGKPAHLHYSIFSLLPMPWRIDSSTQGKLKAFYINPLTYLKAID